MKAFFVSPTAPVSIFILSPYSIVAKRFPFVGVFSFGKRKISTAFIVDASRRERVHTVIIPKNIETEHQLVIVLKY